MDHRLGALPVALVAALLLSACSGHQDAEAPSTSAAAPGGSAVGGLAPDDGASSLAGGAGSPVGGSVVAAGDTRGGSAGDSELGDLDPTACDGSYSGLRVEGDIEVAPGAICTLTNMQVEGQLRVGAAGTLVLSGLTVAGDIRADGFVALEIDQTEVGGVVDIRDGVAVEFTGVRITQDLRCEGNVNPPVAADLAVGGRTEGQCADL